MSLGWLLAFLVLAAAFVMFLVGKMDGVQAAMFGGLALAILFSPVTFKAPWQAA
jgi:hypothetical protein